MRLLPDPFNAALDGPVNWKNLFEGRVTGPENRIIADCPKGRPRDAKPCFIEAVLVHAKDCSPAQNDKQRCASSRNAGDKSDSIEWHPERPDLRYRRDDDGARQAKQPETDTGARLRDEQSDKTGEKQDRSQGRQQVSGITEIVECLEPADHRLPAHLRQVDEDHAQGCKTTERKERSCDVPIEEMTRERCISPWPGAEQMRIGEELVAQEGYDRQDAAKHGKAAPKRTRRMIVLMKQEPDGDRQQRHDDGGQVSDRFAGRHRDRAALHESQGNHVGPGRVGEGMILKRQGLQEHVTSRDTDQSQTGVHEPPLAPVLHPHESARRQQKSEGDAVGVIETPCERTIGDHRRSDGQHKQPPKRRDVRLASGLKGQGAGQRELRTASPVTRKRFAVQARGVPFSNDTGGAALNYD